MSPRPLALVLLAACFVDDKPVDEATGAGTTTTTADASSSTSAPTSTEPPPPVCGDGVLAGDEECDDGNLSDLDDCLADCTSATCKDGFKNQIETDVDCGGSCMACGPCRACIVDADCDDDLRCIESRCDERHLVEYDWLADCSADRSAHVPVPTVYAGDWRVEALGGGGRVKELPDVYGWRADCVGFDLTGLRAPFTHTSPGAAFDALDPKFIVLPYAGGPTSCGFVDTACADNVGSTTLALRLACE